MHIIGPNYMDLSNKSRRSPRVLILLLIISIGSYASIEPSFGYSRSVQLHALHRVPHDGSKSGLQCIIKLNLVNFKINFCIYLF